MKLWEPTRCCCCCDLRTGSIVIGILLLIGGAFSLLSGVQNLVMSNDERIAETCKDNTDTALCEEEVKKLGLGIGVSTLLIACFHIGFSSLLLYGILKKKTAFFIPLMTVYIMQISVMILAGTACIIFLMYLGIPFVAIFFFAGLFGLMVFFETYCLLVIRAHYYEIKREKGQVHTALDDHNLEAPPYPGPQVPPYPGYDAPPNYPGSDAPLYPDTEKLPK